MKAWLLAAMTVAHACGAHAAAIASGRNWRLAIDSIECEPAAALVTLGMRIDYLGPKGPVEAPLSQLVDADGKPHLPRSLVWRRGSKPLAAWLSAGGLSNLQSESVAEIQLKFDVREAPGDLHLEFGDIRAFALTRRRGAGCEGLLRPEQVRAPRAAPREGAKPGMRVYRNRYLCTQASGTPRTMEASYPPYLPRQLLLFGRGYLPNARQIELPMGQAPAQPYLYSGLDELNAVEDAARRAIGADFPQYAGGAHFAFNWGVQKAASGNEMYSVGIYAIGACPRQK
jgi:hypothetical protein